MNTSKLDQAVLSFIAFTRSLPSQMMAPSKTERWGPREVLIHLVFWHEQYDQIAAAVAANQQPKLFQGTFKDINRFAVAQDISAPIEELITRWTRAHHALVRTARARRADRLKFSLRKGSKEWPLSDLVRLAARHIQNHQTKLRRSLRTRKPSAGHGQVRAAFTS